MITGLKNFDKKNIGKYVVDFVNYIYLFIVLCVYPLVFNNYYFDITKTRRDFFINTAILYIVLIFSAYIFESTWSYYNKVKSVTAIKISGRTLFAPELWMTFFVVSNFFAYLISITDDGLIDGNSSFTGENGRLMGLSMYLIIGLVFVLLCRYTDIKLGIYVLFGIVTLFSYIVAVYQHIDPDLSRYGRDDYKPKGLKVITGWFPHYVFELKKGISKKQYNIFVSTFGNINIFSSFIVISLGCFICMFIFSKKIFYRIFAGIIVSVGGVVMMIANSDSAYIGVGTVIILMFFLAFKDGLITRFLQALIFLGIGNLGIVLINRYISEVLNKKYDKRGGFAEHLDRLDYAIIILAFLIVLYIAVFVIEKKWGDKIESINKNRIIKIMLIVLAVGLVAIVFIGNKLQIGAFTFNYRWGTYRGYIWTKSVDLFKRAPLLNKIFGYGNESLRTLMNTYYYDEMVEVTNKIYDNAHNELLQYLVTTGLCGMLSYIGLFASCFYYILKNSDNEVIAYMSLSVMLGYFVQGIINLNQPITTPFYFVFMAVGVGYVRSLVKKSKDTNR